MPSNLWKDGNPPDDVSGHIERNIELVDYLATTCRVFVEPKHQEAFQHVANEVEQWVRKNCSECSATHGELVAKADTVTKGDPRRRRYLLRLVVGRISHLFLADNPVFPKTIVEGLDVYLKRALGEIAYADLNRDAKTLIDGLDAADDDEMWRRISADVESRHWSDTIFIRILLRFTDFDGAKEHMIRVIDGTTVEKSGFPFKEWHFTILFDSMFGDIYRSLTYDDQRHQWEVLFGDGTSDSLMRIFNRFADDSLGSLIRYQKISGYQAKFVLSAAS